ncbi:hypothetical protein [Promicromonospora sp. NFX87]|uniref:hypothetical protein n=1 Tax=Promicromonospora sp. NFX87 TaxID=3402691 RepID=UPI003AFA8F90
MVAFSLALAGPVPVPGLGTVTLPGSEQVRELLGIADSSRCEAPEPAVPRGAVEVDTNLRPGVTFHVTDARPISRCFDVRIDAVLPGDGVSPEALTDDGTLWRAPRQGDDVARFLRRVNPLDDGATDLLAAPLVTPADRESTIGDVTTVESLTAHGNRAAWFEITRESTDPTPHRIVLAAGGTRSGAVTADGYESRSITEIEGQYHYRLAVTAQRVAWRQEGAPSGSTSDLTTPEWLTMPAWVTSIDSGKPESLGVHTTAIGADDDEIVVATLDELAGRRSTTTFTSFGDNGRETTVLTLEHPHGTTVEFVDITDDVVTYALLGGDVVVVPRVNGVADVEGGEAVAVRLADGAMGDAMSTLSADGDTVAWVSGAVAYLLRDTATSRAASPDLVRIGQSGPRGHVMVGLAGDRIAWSTIKRSTVTINVGTLRE